MSDLNKYQDQTVVADVIGVGSQYQAISVTTSASEAKGGSTHLLNRKVLSITPTNGTIYWGTNSSVTTVTGSPIFQNQTVVMSFAETITIFLIATTTTDVRIMEGS